MVDPTSQIVICELLKQLAAQNELILRYASQLGRGVATAPTYASTPLPVEIMNGDQRQRSSGDLATQSLEPDIGEDVWSDNGP